MSPGEITGATFPVCGALTVGYDEREVDVLLDRVAEVFAGRAGPDAAQVREVVFGEHRGRGAYRKQAVDDFLARVLTEWPGTAAPAAPVEVSAPGQLTASDVRRVRFSRCSALGVGYDRARVDAMLARIAARFDGTDVSLRTDDVRYADLGNVRRGYRSDEVDALLLRVVADWPR